MRDAEPAGTETSDYTERLRHREAAWWKRVIDIRGIYGWNLRRFEPGFTLDVGCGLGRNLRFLAGHGVGVDHNASSVAECRARGFEAYTPEAFAERHPIGEPRFDSLLFAHVVEHMSWDDASALVTHYRPYLKPDGRLILIAPQPSGYRSDPTHETFMDFDRLSALATAVGCSVERRLSFPFPRFAFGQLFRYNEFVVVARAGAGSKGPNGPG